MPTLPNLEKIAGLKTDRLFLDGKWKFEISRDSYYDISPIRMGPVSCSSFAYKGKFNRCPAWPLLAFDKKMDTSWIPVSDDLVPWIQIDLGKYHNKISETKIFLEAFMPRGYSIESSLDGREWQSIYSGDTREVNGINIECGGNFNFEQPSGKMWSPSLDIVQSTEDYSYKMITPANQVLVRPLSLLNTCWCTQDKMEFTLEFPKNERQRLWLYLFSGSGRKERIWVDGKELGVYENFSQPRGLWIHTSLSNEAVKLGRARIVIEKLAGTIAILSRVFLENIEGQSEKESNLQVPSSLTTEDTAGFAPAKDVGRFLRFAFKGEDSLSVREIEIIMNNGNRWNLPPGSTGFFDDIRYYRDDEKFYAWDYDDSDWSNISVPSYWEQSNFSKPTFYFPDDAVGYYRKVFMVESEFKGKIVILQFDGVNNSAEVWLNGHRLGYHESGWTQFNFDVSKYLNCGGSNLLALRVAKISTSSAMDSNDHFFCGGIWRSCYLYAIPQSGILDYTINADLDNGYRNATLDVLVKLGESRKPLLVKGKLYNVEGRQIETPEFSAMLTGEGILSTRIKNPAKWTAEKPNLYSLKLEIWDKNSLIHEIKTSVGFRKVEIKDKTLCVNGVPIHIAGNLTIRAQPHTLDAPQSQVNKKEIQLIKECNTNTIRSHTTPLEDDFLNRCDAAGIYVIAEVPYVWFCQNNYPWIDDKAFLRVYEVYQQHKNHPSVIIWDIGNEFAGGTSPSSQTYLMAQKMAKLDNSRPILTSCTKAMREAGTTIDDYHYNIQKHMSQDQFKKTTYPSIWTEFAAIPLKLTYMSDQTFIESWGREFNRQYNVLYKNEGIVGGVTCAWEDGKIKDDDGATQWGVVDACRNPKPVYWYVKNTYAQVHLDRKSFVVDVDKGIVSIRAENRFDFTDFRELNWYWSVQFRGVTLAESHFSIELAPQKSRMLLLKIDRTVLQQGEWLSLRIDHPAGYNIVQDRYPLFSRDKAKKLPVYFISLAPEFKLPSNKITEVDGSVFYGNVRLKGFTMPQSSVETIKSYEMNRSGAAWTVKFSQNLRAKVEVQYDVGDKLKFKYSVESNGEGTLTEFGVPLEFEKAVYQFIVFRDALWGVYPDYIPNGGDYEVVSPEVFKSSFGRRCVSWVLACFTDGSGVMIDVGGRDVLFRQKVNGISNLVLCDYLARQEFLGAEFPTYLSYKPGVLFQSEIVLIPLSKKGVNWWLNVGFQHITK